MLSVDAIILGAGAAGLFCAAQAGQRGLRVLLIDHAARLAEKIRISGGGRCNFTNLHTTPAQFLSANPDFCRSALARYTPADFVALVQQHGIGFHEKHKGQLFCDDSSAQIIHMLVAECDRGQVQRWQPCQVQAVHGLPAADKPPHGALPVHALPTPRGGPARFELHTDRGPAQCRHLVVATGGLSIPQIGASDFGHRLARQFGHRIVPTRPALVPLTFDDGAWAPLLPLAGVSLPVHLATGKGKGAAKFDEDLLFTHRGLSGPAVLQISSYWQPGQTIALNLLPGQDLAELLRLAKLQSRRQLGKELGQWLPQRLADSWLAQLGLDAQRPMPEQKDRDLQRLADAVQRWSISPTGTEG